MAASLGMSSTHLNQPFIGCGFQGGVRNELTLSDAQQAWPYLTYGSLVTVTAGALTPAGSPTA